MGSRPDGWWRDRAGAARRLGEELSAARLPYDEVVLVLEGEARGYGPDVQARDLTVVLARGSGDDALVAEVEEQVGADDGREVLVVTADRDLRMRVEAVGARAVGPSWLLAQL